MGLRPLTFTCSSFLFSHLQVGHPYPVVKIEGQRTQAPRVQTLHHLTFTREHGQFGRGALCPSVIPLHSTPQTGVSCFGAVHWGIPSRIPAPRRWGSLLGRGDTGNPYHILFSSPSQASRKRPTQKRSTPAVATLDFWP